MSLTTDLLHYWPMEEASGATVLDWVGEQNGLIVHDDAAGSDTVTTGFLGSGRNLSKNNDRHGYFQWWGGAFNADTVLPAWTVSFAVNLSSSARTFGLFETEGGPYNQPTYSYIEIALYDSNQGINLTIESDDVTFIETGKVVAGFTDNNWHQLTLVCSGTTTKLYVDAVEEISISAAVDLYTEPRTNSAYSTGINGAMDEFAIWGRALSAQEVADLWNGGAGVRLADPPPVVDLSFNPSPLSSQFSYMDIDDGVLSPLRIPVSSWQATLQADRSSFVQAVIPGALDWVDDITARQATGEIILTYAVRDIDGNEQTWEVARVPLQQINFDQGPQRATARVTSYATIAGGDAGTTVTLQNVRSVSTSSGGVRMRCDIDPTIKPGNTAVSGSTSFVVAYINHYATSSDRYMDVGERPL